MRPLNPDEIVLVENAQKGKDAFEQLVRRYQHDVFRLIRIYTRNDSDAEDLAQETWIKVYRSIGKLKEPERFTAWLEAIAVNTAKNWLKSRAYRNAQETEGIEADADEMEPQGILSSAILEYQRQRQIEQIRDAIDSLSEKNRAVVYEFYICGYSADQISQRLQLPVSTVNSRLKEARKHLREEFATMVALSKIQETFAPEHFVQQVMERVASLPVPVPKGGLIDKIKSLLPAKTVTAIGIATAVLGTGVAVTFTQLRHLQPAAQAQLADTKIAFSSDRDDGNWEIYVMDADGSNPINLTHNPASDSFTSWSPDGTKIAFDSNRDGNGEIYVMNADGKNLQRLTNHLAKDWYPSWSPDGKKIAFMSDRNSNYEIYVMDADGKNQINLTKHPGTDSSPSWSPDGTKIAFMSARDGRGEIYVMNADGTDPINLTQNPAFDTTPSWSPNGRKIAFMSTRDGNNDEIYVMNADGTEPINLTQHIPAVDAAPSWSPDGRKIAFMSDRDDGNYEIFVMDADGKNPINLTKNLAQDLYPSWSPAPKLAVSLKDRWATVWGRLKGRR